MRSHCSLHDLAATCALALLAVAPGCRTPPPAPGELRARVQALAPPPILLAAIDPRSLATGATARVQARCVVGGREVARFDVTDAYFKTLFTVVARLRELGFTIEAAPAIWQARADAVAREVDALDDAQVLVHLSRNAPPETLLAVHALSANDLRARLVAARVLLAARSGLPPQPGRPAPGARRIRERWFTREDHPRRPWRLTLELEALTYTARGLAPGGTLEAQVRLRWQLRDTRTGQTILTLRTDQHARLEGSGLRYRARSGRYTLTIPAPDALTRALRRATDAFCDRLLRALEARGAHQAARVETNRSLRPIFLNKGSRA